MRAVEKSIEGRRKGHAFVKMNDPDGWGNQVGDDSREDWLQSY